jgi:hypothetical protein
VVIVASKRIHWCDQQSHSVGVTNDLWTSFPAAAPMRRDQDS